MPGLAIRGPGQWKTILAGTVPAIGRISAKRRHGTMRGRRAVPTSRLARRSRRHGRALGCGHLRLPDSQTTYGLQCFGAATWPPPAPPAHPRRRSRDQDQELPIPEPRTPTEKEEEVVPEPSHPMAMDVPAPCTPPAELHKVSSEEEVVAAAPGDDAGPDATTSMVHPQVQVKAKPKPHLWKPRPVSLLVAQPVEPPVDQPPRLIRGSVGRLLQQTAVSKDCQTRHFCGPLSTPADQSHHCSEDSA